MNDGENPWVKERENPHSRFLEAAQRLFVAKCVITFLRVAT